MTCFLLPRYRPRPPCCCSTISYSLSRARGEWNATNYRTLRLTVYSIHEAGRGGGGRTKGRVRLFLFFFLFSLLFFFLSFSLSLSSNRHANAKKTDRQTESLNSLRLASPRFGRGTALPACLNPLFSFSGFGLFPFFVPPPPPLLLLSFSIDQSIKTKIKQTSLPSSPHQMGIQPSKTELFLPSQTLRECHPDKCWCDRPFHRSSRFVYVERGGTNPHLPLSTP